jgi:ParB family transcriptional regulator, chromosome partitioning protein
MSTFKQKILAGEIKRADAMKVRYEDLHVEPGFNLRLSLDKLSHEDRAIAEADDENLFQHIMSGGQLPAMEVRPRPEGGVWIVDGHRRHKQLGRAIEGGAPLADKDGVVWVRIEAFPGSDADRTLRVMSSADGRKLLPLEVAEGYKRLRGMGWDNERIAKHRNKTPQHVAQMLTLADANSDVQNMVAAGDVSAAVAVNVVRKHGDDAGKVLADAASAARANGKRKVTAGTLEGKPLPRKVVDEVEDALKWFRNEGLDMESRVIVTQAASGNSFYRDAVVEVSAGALAELMKAVALIEETREHQAAAAREKAAKAAQTDIEDAA